MTLEVKKVQSVSNQSMEITNNSTAVKNNAANTSGSKTQKTEELEYIEIAELEEENTKAKTNAKTDYYKDGLEKNEFEEILSKNTEIKKLIDDFSLDETFDIFDKNEDGIITTNEINKVNSSCEKLEDFTKGEIKKLIKDAKEEYDEELEDIKTRLKKVLVLDKNGTIKRRKSNKTHTSSNTNSKTTVTKQIPSALAKKLDAKLGAGFCAKVEEISKRIKCNPNDLLGMMYSESGINPTAKNKSSGASGLIQFMPKTAKALGTTTEALRNMSAIEQLDYVEKFYLVNKKTFYSSDATLTAGDLYTLCFLPAFCKREILCSKNDKKTARYYKNTGLDLDHNGDVSKTDLTKRVQKKYKELLSYYKIT